MVTPCLHAIIAETENLLLPSVFAEIENLASGHPAVAEAAVVAMPSVKWGERPLLVVVLKPPLVQVSAERRLALRTQILVCLSYQGGAAAPGCSAPSLKCVSINLVACLKFHYEK